LEWISSRFLDLNVDLLLSFGRYGDSFSSFDVIELFISSTEGYLDSTTSGKLSKAVPNGDLSKFIENFFLISAWR
jgi:hypothetical protein